MQKSHSGQIVIPSKAPSVIPIVDPTAEGEASEKTTKVVLKPPLKGYKEIVLYLLRCKLADLYKCRKHQWKEAL